jgi:FKBP-type peptidyl-prolyl cis-trans isomerase SlyD
MPVRHFLLLIMIGAALLLGQGLVMNYVQALPAFVQMNNDAVRNGVKVTVQYQITLRDNPTTIYSAREEFVQGQHIIPYAIEQQLAGMQPGEIKAFPLSAEEGFGPYDETKTQTIPTADLPLDAREGDIVDDDAGRTAKILRIFTDRTVLDLNHPLAGQALMITLMIVAIEIPGAMEKNTIIGNGALDVLIVDPGIDSVPIDLDLQRISTEDVPAMDLATFCLGDMRADFNPGAAATAMAL